MYLGIRQFKFRSQTLGTPQMNLKLIVSTFCSRAAVKTQKDFVQIPCLLFDMIGILGLLCCITSDKNRRCVEV